MKNECVLSTGSQPSVCWGDALTQVWLAFCIMVKSQGTSAVGIPLAVSLAPCALPHPTDQPTPSLVLTLMGLLVGFCKAFFEILIKQSTLSHSGNRGSNWPTSNRHSSDLLACKYHSSLIPCADISIFLFLHVVGHCLGKLGSRTKLDVYT